MSDIKEPIKKQFDNAYNEDDVSSKELVDLTVEALLEKKGREIVVMDLSELTTLTEYFVVCHGNSDVQIKALADSVEDKLREQANTRAWKKEGLNARSWIILDFVNIVVHVMSKEKREFYKLEQMWNDAVITPIEDEIPES